VIEVARLAKSFIGRRGRSKTLVKAVTDVSFVAKDGRITALLGPNGAGKTTTLRVLATLMQADQGTATVGGFDVAANPVAVRTELGVLSDARGLYTRLTARENVLYYADLRRVPRAECASRLAMLADLLDMRDLLERRTDGFSTGERMKVALARALIHDPRHLILDEPTNGLDVTSTRAMRRLLRHLRDQGKCLLFSTHIMQEVEQLCDEIVIVAHGQTVAHGTAPDLCTAAGTDNLEDAFVQLDGKSANDMLLVRDIALPLNFTGEQRRNESWEKRKFPQTRMGLAAQLRQTFLDAQDYSERWADYEKKKPDTFSKADDKKGPPSPPKRDLRLEALLPYLLGKKSIVLAAREPSDLETAVGLAQQFKLRFVLNHVSHSQPVLDYVASLKVPVIVGPIYENPKNYERYDAVYKLPGELYKRGVKIAFASYDAHAVRNLPYAAGYATAFGLPHDEALKAITLNPAEIWGVADQLGSLDVGKTANVVVADGDPLDVKTDVKRIFIAGRQVPMTSRQTVLRDRYSAK